MIYSICNYNIVAAAVCVSCQELTSTLRDRSHVCPNEEVTFTCTVRGSQNLTTLILAWSSVEYIGQGDPLRFTTDNVPGATRTSMIDGNVTATLISNTDINGVPVLVSELCIVVDQASTVTCGSESTSSEDSAVFNVSGTCACMYCMRSLLLSYIFELRYMYIHVHVHVHVHIYRGRLVNNIF